MENTKTVVKFGEWIEAGFNLYKENFVLLVLANFIAVILGLVTMGILAGPMLGGLILITLGLLDKNEKKPEVGNLFDGFQYFLDAFLFIIVWGAISVVVTMLLNIVPCAGQILSLFVSIVISTLVMFGLYLIVDRKMSFWPASMASINLVKNNFFPFAGLMIVAGAFGYIGAFACGVGVLITLPLTTCIIAVAYRDIFGKP